MTIADLIFKGNVLRVKTNPGGIEVKCYDWLQQLNNEHIPPNEGVYAGVDAGAIIKDIITNSTHNFEASVVISTKTIIDNIDLTDKSRLQAIKTLIGLINGNPETEVYHIYCKGTSIIFSTLPNYVNEEPAHSLTDSEIITLSQEEDGSSYYNCCTVVGSGVRSYYPAQEDSNGDLVPDFPTNPRHKLISDSSLQSVAQCYQYARGFVRTHNVIPKRISVSFVTNRFDFFPGQLIYVDSPKYDIFGKFRIKEISWVYDNSSSMSLTLSDAETIKLTTYIK